MTAPTLPHEIEAAMTGIAITVGRADGAAARDRARDAITTALAAARETGRRDVLDAQVSAIAAGIVADVRDGLSVTKAMAAFVDAIEREQRGEQIDGDPVTDLTAAIKRSQDAAEARGREAGRREVLDGPSDEPPLWLHGALMDVEAAADRRSGFVAACNRLRVAISTDRERAVAGMRPAMSREDAERLVNDADPTRVRGISVADCLAKVDNARTALLAALTGTRPPPSASPVEPRRPVEGWVDAGDGWWTLGRVEDWLVSAHVMPSAVRGFRWGVDTSGVMSHAGYCGAADSLVAAQLAAEDALRTIFAEGAKALGMAVRS